MFQSHFFTVDKRGGTPTKSRGFGRNGCRGGIAGAGSTGAGSLHSSSAALCQRLELSIGTPPRARLSHEEPEAGNLHIRVCEGRGRATSSSTRPPHILASGRGRGVAGSFKDGKSASLSVTADHDDRAIRPGRTYGRDRSHPGRGHADVAWSTRHH